MGLLEDGTAAKILQDPKIADDIALRLSSDPEVVAELADELADVLEDAIKEDDGLRQKILLSMSGNVTFRRRLLQEVSKKLG